MGKCYSSSLRFRAPVLSTRNSGIDAFIDSDKKNPIAINEPTKTSRESVQLRTNNRKNLVTFQTLIIDQKLPIKNNFKRAILLGK